MILARKTHVFHAKSDVVFTPSPCKKKYKAYILKYKAHILKYMPYIFCLFRLLKNNNLQKPQNKHCQACKIHLDFQPLCKPETQKNEPDA